jgi:hypothetical protein
VFLPASTIARLGPTDYLTLGYVGPSVGGTYGWSLRVRQNGALYVAGYDSNGAASEFRAYGSIPTDRWVSLELGLHSQNGPGVKRAFAFLLDGQFYGWYRQGHLAGETYDRVALGIVNTTSAGPLEVFVDEWREPGTGNLPTGPDTRPTDAVQEQDFRSQSGVQVQYDWSTWTLGPTLSASAGLYSANDRIQAGRNLDRMPDLTSGWAEIEVDWPQGTPNGQPTTYFGPMVGFRKEINREENLEVIPIGRGAGNVDLVLEAWVGSPVELGQWQMPLNAARTSRIPEPGDIIRVRWEQVSAGTLGVRASYYDASTATWYVDIINGVYPITSISGGGNTVNYTDGFHTTSSVTIDSQFYSIRRYRVGTLATYP